MLISDYWWALRKATGCQRNQPCGQRVRTFSLSPHVPLHPSTSRVGGGVGNWVTNQSCLCDETSVTVSKLGFSDHPDWWTHPCARRVGPVQLSSGQKLRCLGILWTRAMYVFLRLFIYTLYNVLYNRLNVFPWVLWASVANDWTWGGSDGEPLICSPVGQKCELNGYPQLAISVWSGSLSCWTQPLICGVCPSCR